MKAIFYLKNGESETIDFTDMLIDRKFIDVGLKRKMIRPPDNHPVDEITFKVKDIKRFVIEYD
jgi:hypothetical protein